VQKVTATISAGGTVVANGVETWLQNTSSAGGTAVGWRGRVMLPPGVLLTEEGVYDLRADDGRAGRIRVDRVVPSGPRQVVVLFTGDGPFA
jgi:hypothetical protein